MLNYIVIMGRMTRDPELRRTQNDKTVASFTLAVDRDYNAPGEDKQTDFIDVVAWNKTAEFVQKYFSKGQMAIAEGRLQLRDWTDKDGNKRRSAEINAEHIRFGESKARNNEHSVAQGEAAALPPPSAGGKLTEITDEINDGELPF